jgi:fatty acid synthase
LKIVKINRSCLFHSVWQSNGVEVLISKPDIVTKSGCEDLLYESMKLGPIGGIFNLAAHLADGMLENQNAKNFVECMAPKALATHYLDELSRKMCPHLHYFIVFSSGSCGMGNAGQSNYGMANSVMERIMEKRYRDGLPAKAIEWGPFADVGMAYELFFKKLNNNFDFEVLGIIPQSVSSCLEKLDVLITSSDPIVSSFVIRERTFEKQSNLSVVDQIKRLFNINDLKKFPPGNAWLFELPFY